jgi:hypothetical protein
MAVQQSAVAELERLLAAEVLDEVGDAVGLERALVVAPPPVAAHTSPTGRVNDTASGVPDLLS